MGGPSPPRLQLLAVAVLVATAGCSMPMLDGSASEERTATVVSVVDGDTVDVRFADGTEERVRLLGVDTPEVHADVSPGEFEGVPDTEAGRACLRDWGERASEFATERLAGAEVTVATDPEADRRGGYGRLLAYVTVDGESFNRALLDRGYARLYDSEFSRLDGFTAEERDARENDTGLWACAA
ncbi:thermonuclease family protein [Halobacterium litoreum]|uniref:Thermonuclease family protein n=1 Tax=Halobacterium litoreum TaxID=2039234 RepID=A0ABD5NB44_9EURY|nr:thermonuclease family protein [Halobacterium litoreum]UHH14615.1 thermonuclease family protein [Halobacterium litoreum]